MDQHDPITADLDESQLNAVTATGAPQVCVLAGPGSGKTRVLTARIAHRCATGTASPEHTVAVTFTRRAALELRHRLNSIGLHDGVTSGTFHSLAYGELRRRWRDRGDRSPSLLTRTTRAVAELLPQDTPLPDVRRVAEEVAWTSAIDIGASAYAPAAVGRRGLPISTEQMAEILVGYGDWKRRRNLVDFDDLLRLFSEELRADPDYQAAIRWRHRHFHVDEFQDLNPLQFALLAAWSADDLFVVGDPNQAIFGWNGADSRYLNDFQRYYPGAEVIRLGYSYRCTPEILGNAYAVLDPDGSKVTPTCARPSGPAPSFSSHADELEEAAALARRVRDTRGPNGSWSAQAILVRTRDQVVAVAEALRRAGIPHFVRDETSFARLPEIASTLDDMMRRDRPLSIEIADLRADTGGADEVDERVQNLRTLCELGLDHLRLDPEASSRAFVRWVRATYRNQGLDPAGDAVDILTFHAAKGLEWSAVHIAGAEQGLVPIHGAATPEAQAEERRLLFVAMTRAQRHLHVSWAETRRFGDAVFERARSPLLAPLVESEPPPATEAASERAARPAGIAAAREALRQ